MYSVIFEEKGRALGLESAWSSVDSIPRIKIEQYLLFSHESFVFLISRLSCDHILTRISVKITMVASALNSVSKLSLCQFDFSLP